ncbi:unnamed protein product [Phytophthora lilii]|uniref:Unnamed protein product n=1 Tax=Phytophthora lilii TaxID=2077276 RepID=A0A9W6TG59_9STRA|nr:unnamed protein product [Phytophthora lilii]
MTEVASLVAGFVIPGVDEVIVAALKNMENLVEQTKENEENLQARTDAVRWKALECLLPPDTESDPQFNPRFASDMYSFEMCIVEAFLGHPPYGFEDDDAVMEKKFNKEMYPRVDGMNDKEWAFVERLLDPDWKTRMALEEAVEILKQFADREMAAKPKTTEVRRPEADPVETLTIADHKESVGLKVVKTTRVCSCCEAEVPVQFNFCGNCSAPTSEAAVTRFTFGQLNSLFKKLDGLYKMMGLQSYHPVEKIEVAVQKGREELKSCAENVAAIEATLNEDGYREGVVLLGVLSRFRDGSTNSKSMPPEQVDLAQKTFERAAAVLKRRNEELPLIRSASSRELLWSLTMKPFLIEGFTPLLMSEQDGLGLQWWSSAS